MQIHHCYWERFLKMISTTIASIHLCLETILLFVVLVTLYNLRIESLLCKNSAPWVFGQAFTRAFIPPLRFMNLTDFLLQRCMCSVFSYACFPGPQISAITARMCALCHRLILQSLRLRWGTGCLLGINTHRRVEEKVGLGRGEVEVYQRLPKPWSTLVYRSHQAGKA